MMLCRFVGVLALIATLLVPGSAFAGKASKLLPLAPAPSGYQNKPIATGATVWYCAYGGNTKILCRLGDSGGKSTRPVQTVDRRLPGIVGDILNQPQRLSGGHIWIPLHTDPYDFELVGQLAEAVMCGSSASCGVVFAESIGALHDLVRNFERGRQGSDPSRLADAYSPGDGDS